MFGNLLSVETTDALDWAIAGLGCLTLALLLWHCIVGFNLLEPGAYWSGEGRVAAIAFALWSVLVMANWLWPVRSTVYVVNNDYDSLDVVAGGQDICLPSKSYRGFVWRSSVPREIMVYDRRTGEETRFPVGPGIWLVNGAHANITADFLADSGGSAAAMQTDVVALGGKQTLRVALRGGSSIHFYSAMPLDRIFSVGGDMAARHSAGPCAAAR